MFQPDMVNWRGAIVRYLAAGDGRNPRGWIVRLPFDGSAEQWLINQ